MRSTGRRWAIVLAAGDGTRLSSLTTDREGVTTPKQYCTLNAGRSLLEDTIDRARRIAPRSRIVTIVAERHRSWWGGLLSYQHPANVIAQPRNKGTAVGILLPLLSIAARDPHARIAVLPSDHYVENERILESALRRAFAEVERRPDDVVLLGIEPEAPEPDYGWIVPGGPDSSAARPVARFVEKPDRSAAERLMEAGAVWNSFLFVAAAPALLALYRRRLLELLLALRGAVGPDGAPGPGLSSRYRLLDDADFSRQVLCGSEESLRVLAVPACGWTDLGTPARVAQCLSGLPGPPVERASRVPGMGAALELSAMLATSPS
ncbi:MAG TPA: sugar phosphate nucleotidyltransferase [Candidatus Polarisedimenticolia bacterium]|nr:sugar phosphate nucleotidyltransferase [Candidatus Polarisedimenticolia bacterium]